MCKLKTRAQKATITCISTYMSMYVRVANANISCFIDWFAQKTCKFPTSLASMPTSVQCSQGFSFQVKSLWNASTRPEATQRSKIVEQWIIFMTMYIIYFQVTTWHPSFFYKDVINMNEDHKYWEIIPPFIQSFNKIQHLGWGWVR